MHKRAPFDGARLFYTPSAIFGLFVRLLAAAAFFQSAVWLSRNGDAANPVGRDLRPVVVGSTTSIRAFPG